MRLFGVFPYPVTFTRKKPNLILLNNPLPFYCSFETFEVSVRTSSSRKIKFPHRNMNLLIFSTIKVSIYAFRLDF